MNYGLLAGIVRVGISSLNRDRRVEVPKIKTHRGAKKRFSITASGKIKRGRSHARHILTKKPTKRKRKLDQSALVSGTEVSKIKKMLPYAS